MSGGAASNKRLLSSASHCGPYPNLAFPGLFKLSKDFEQELIWLSYYYPSLVETLQ
jgi:hypothetical protein